MTGNRHVPLIMGVVSITIAVCLIFWVSSWWSIIPAALLLMFGLPSIKTALFASATEIDELTGSKPMTDETRKKFEDRI